MLLSIGLSIASNVTESAKDPMIDEWSDDVRLMHLMNNKNIKMSKIGFLSVNRRKCIHPNNQHLKLIYNFIVMYICEIYFLKHLG